MITLSLDLQYKLADSARDLTRDQINFLLIAMKRRMQAAEMASLTGTGTTRIIFDNDGE